MNKIRVKINMVFLVIFLIAPYICNGQESGADDKIMQDTTFHYKDGIYEGRSQSVYSAEPYWGIAQLTVKNGLLTRVTFLIRDSSLHETFNEKYETHFPGNPVYVEQCRNDWKGVQTYPGLMVEKQDINKVDAMTGATWSCNIFKSSVKEALNSAK